MIYCSSLCSHCSRPAGWCWRRDCHPLPSSAASPYHPPSLRHIFHLKTLPNFCPHTCSHSHRLSSGQAQQPTARQTPPHVAAPPARVLAHLAALLKGLLKERWEEMQNLAGVGAAVRKWYWGPRGGISGKVGAAGSSEKCSRLAGREVWVIFVIPASAGWAGAETSALLVGQEQPHELQPVSTSGYLLCF